MVALGGLVSPDGDGWDAIYGRCKVVFPHGGMQHSVRELVSREVAALVCDALAVKQVVDAGRLDLSLLSLRSQQHSPLRLSEGASRVIRGASFQQLVQQLQDCATPAVQRWETFRTLDSAVRTAASLGHTCALQILLLLDPSAAAATNVGSQSPLHVAAHYGHAAAAQLLLAAAPRTASATDCRGWTPLHACACYGSVGVARLLLAAAPGTAAAVDRRGWTPLHAAVRHGHSAAVRLLLAAAVQDSAGQTPLQLALSSDKGQDTLAEFIIARHQLTEEEWAAVPAPCPGLARALPAALEQSEAQARRLMRHLPPCHVQRLRTFALCLARQQQRVGVPLPPSVLGALLARSVAA